MGKLLSVIIYSSFVALVSFHSVQNDSCEEIDLILEEHNQFKNSNPSRAVELLDSAYHLSIEVECRNQANKCIYYYGAIKSADRDYDTSDSLFHICLDFYSNKSDSIGISDVMVWLGWNAQSQGIYDDADSLFREADGLIDAATYPERKGDILNNLGISEDRRGNYDTAIDLYLEAVKYHRISRDSVSLAKSLSNASTVMYNIEEYEKALEYQEDALAVSKAINDKRTQVMNHSCLSSYWLKLKNFEKARQHANVAVSLATQLDYTEGLIYAITALGDTHLALNEYEEALFMYEEVLDTSRYKLSMSERLRIGMKITEVNFRTNHNTEASTVLNGNKTLSALEDVESPQDKMEYNWLQSKIAEQEEDAELALVKLKESNRFRDSFIDQEKNKAAIDAAFKYDSEELGEANKDLQIKNSEYSQLVASRSRYLWMSILGALLFCASSFYLWKRNQRNKAENEILLRKKKEAEAMRREVEHRYLNQMNVAIKLLEDSKRAIGESSEFTVFDDYENKLHAISLLGQLLSSKNMHKEIELSEYLTNITNNLVFNIPEGYEERVNVTPQLIRLVLKSDIALLVGLIYTELFTNSIKHAFGGDVDPSIALTTNISADQQLVIEYMDNGKGVDIDKDSNGQGMDLINNMVNQVNGKYEFLDPTSGFGLLIKIPLVA